MFLELLGQGFGLSCNYNNGGDGFVCFDFCSLGSGCMLIFVNGCCWVNFGEGVNSFVDLNFILFVVVECVEILCDGVFVIYGFDVIVGVVNIIMKDDYEGFEFIYQIGEYFDGGGMVMFFIVIFGMMSDNVFIMGGLFYVNISVFFNVDCVQIVVCLFFGGFFGMLQGCFVYGGVVLGCFNFQLLEGIVGMVLGDFCCWEFLEDCFNYNLYNYVEMLFECYNVFLCVIYDILDIQFFYVDMFYQNCQFEQLFVLMLFFYGFGDFGGQEGIVVFNLFNLFGLEFCGFDGLMVDGCICDDVMLGVGNYVVGWFGCCMFEVGNCLFQQDIIIYIVCFGFDGEFVGWNYSVYYFYGQNEFVIMMEGFLNIGNICCVLFGDDCMGDCVYLNIFGGQGVDSVYFGDGLWSGFGLIM